VLIGVVMIGESVVPAKDWAKMLADDGNVTIV
jgi:hypothetical protein